MRSFFSHSHPWKWAKIYHWWFPITALEHQRKRIFRHILCRVSAAFRQSHLQQRQFLILSVHPGGCEYINIYCFIYPHVRTCIQNIQCISGMLKCTLSHMLTPLKLGYILVNNVTLLWHNGIIMVQHFLKIFAVHTLMIYLTVNSIFSLRCFALFLGPHLQHMEVSRLGRCWIGPAAASHSHSHSHTDPSLICDLRCSLWQCGILNPQSEARDRTHILTEITSGP